MDAVAALAVVLEQTLPAALEEARREVARAQADAADAHLQRQGMAARLLELRRAHEEMAAERGHLLHVNAVLAANLRDDRDQLDEANREVEFLQQELAALKYTKELLDETTRRLRAAEETVEAVEEGCINRVDELEEEIRGLRRQLRQPRAES